MEPFNYTDSESTKFLSSNNDTNVANTNITMNNNNNDVVVSDRIFLLRNVELNLWRYVTPLLFAVGLVGNLLTIFVLRR